MNTFDFTKAVSADVLDTIKAAYHDKPLMFTRATFRQKLVSHDRAVSEAHTCRLFLPTVRSKPWHLQRNPTSLDVCGQQFIGYLETKVPTSICRDWCQGLVQSWIFWKNEHFKFYFKQSVNIKETSLNNCYYKSSHLISIHQPTNLVFLITQ